MLSVSGGSAALGLLASFLIAKYEISFAIHFVNQMTFPTQEAQKRAVCTSHYSATNLNGLRFALAPKSNAYLHSSKSVRIGVVGVGQSVSA